MTLSALTDTARVRMSAPALTANMTDDTIGALIQDASLQVIADRFPKAVRADDEEFDIRELAARYLTLHMATMDSAQGQGVTREKVDVIERDYADKTAKDWLNSSTWGQMYLRLYYKYAAGGPRHVVIQH